jgi:hypothetical protein
MSKKLFSTQRWKRYLKARQEAQGRSAKRRRRRGAGFPYKTPQPIERRGFEALAAPSEFSMVQNAEATISFLNSVRFYSARYNLMLDLSAVEKLTADAVAVLVATVAPLIRKGVLIRSNQPTDPTAQSILMASGFFQHFGSAQPTPHVSHGQILQEKSKKVQPDLARDLIHFGVKALSGADGKCSASYRVLIESMSNTHNHALSAKAKRERSQELETWFATVYADQTRKRVCFTFVDAGVGIFESVRLGTIRALYRFVGLKSDTDILRDLLDGKVESSTGLPYRGKGLPAINRLSESHRIESLIILANDVYANVSTGEYKMLPVAFRGTLLYWEIVVR